MAADEDAFLSRWARRKQAAAAGAPEPELEELEAEAERLAIVEQAEQDEAAIVEAERLAENRAAAEAIDLETVDESTDFKVFMRDGVPTVLRQMALKKLWRIHPIFGVLDGLNDYDHDYNVIDTVLTNFESAWKVGKGYAKKSKEEIREMVEAGKARAEEARQAARDEADAEKRARAEKPEEVDGVDAEAPEAGEVSETGENVELQPDDISNEMAEPIEEDEPPNRVPLRRRFALEDWE